MDKNMYWKNEKGNSAILVMCLLSVMMILFVLVLNFAGALVVKEQATSTSQQAALAATATLYEELPIFISSYEQELQDLLDEQEQDKEEEEEAPESPEEEDKGFNEQVDEEVEKISGSMADYSLNEIQNEALDRVLARELDRGLGGGLLKKIMSEEMEHSWIKEMKESARSTILANGGELAGAKMTVFEDGQIVVESSHEVEGIGYNGFFSGISEHLHKTSKGPEIKFVQKLPGWEGRTYSLE